jgi:hypothetical protein
MHWIEGLAPIEVSAPIEDLAPREDIVAFSCGIDSDPIFCNHQAQVLDGHLTVPFRCSAHRWNLARSREGPEGAKALYLFSACGRDTVPDALLGLFAKPTMRLFEIAVALGNDFIYLTFVVPSWMDVPREAQHICSRRVESSAH